MIIHGGYLRLLTDTDTSKPTGPSDLSDKTSLGPMDLRIFRSKCPIVVVLKIPDFFVTAPSPYPIVV